ncbi:hypothetical protein BAZO_02032 [Schinkia azotoformans LMG 9581]|uniref:DUF2281 domain-containing protein n=2 Tax=Schinkia azotoformans TaxID=1454 RepID=K6DLH8_SCHAZ|nr:hypothetical protein BAZO_02032 [Schinkia azotoformans LMG 9581]
MEEGGLMLTTKEKLLALIDEIPESELDRVLDFAENLVNHPHDYWKNGSESSLDFWDNAIDNEIWNRM